MFASGKRITAEQARGWFGDAADSLLDAGSVQGGAGISVDRNAGVVTLSTGGAQASVGLPIFFGGATYSAGNDRITLSGVTAPPRPSIIYCIAPVALDRSADDLTMLVDGVEYDLVDVVAGNVAARLLTPAGLVGVLWRSGEARHSGGAGASPAGLRHRGYVGGWATDPRSGSDGGRRGGRNIVRVARSRVP